MLLVLPWSGPMPRAVYRFKCPTDVEPSRAASLRKEVERRVPAARDADEIAIDASPPAACDRRDVNGADAFSTVPATDHRLRNDRQPRIARPPSQRAGNLPLSARINDGGERNTGCVERQRRGVGAVVVGEHHRA